jgi:phospholipid/cholesterol/gamma-HCH transport system ATP-binding protein
MAERKKVVEFNGVSKNLGGKQILEKLSFEVYEGETFVIIGYSGTGKSVTLRHLVGLMAPDEGSIRVDGDEITTMSNKELERMRRKFGVLFQSGALIAWLTLYENVELPLLEHTKMNRKKRAEVVQEKLELVNLWQDRAKFPAEISGGMKKRAGLARAIALDPGLVLYDEPTSGLDPVIANEIGKLTIDLRDNHNMTQIVVTHDMQGAYDIADRIAMFYHGKMIQVGTPDEIQSSNMPEVQHFITGGKEGQLSVRSGTAVTRGIAPGMLSARSAQPVATQEPQQEGYVLLSEEEARNTGSIDDEISAETERDLPPLEPDTATEEPPSLEPEENT